MSERSAAGIRRLVHAARVLGADVSGVCREGGRRAVEAKLIKTGIALWEYGDLEAEDIADDLVARGLLIYANLFLSVFSRSRLNPS